jgi:hypothetical protein
MKTTTILVSLTLAALALSGCACGPAQCTAGAATCACKPDSTCDANLVCGPANTCVPPVTAGIAVDDASARGCEVLLAEAGGTTVASVTFKGGVQGTWIRQAPKVAVSFVAGGDSALGGNVELGLVGGGASGVTVTKASCVDRLGARLTTTPVVR